MSHNSLQINAVVFWGIFFFLMPCLCRGLLWGQCRWLFIFTLPPQRHVRRPCSRIWVCVRAGLRRWVNALYVFWWRVLSQLTFTQRRKYGKHSVALCVESFDKKSTKGDMHNITQAVLPVSTAMETNMLAVLTWWFSASVFIIFSSTFHSSGATVHRRHWLRVICFAV